MNPLSRHLKCSRRRLLKGLRARANKAICDAGDSRKRRGDRHGDVDIHAKKKKKRQNDNAIKLVTQHCSICLSVYTSTSRCCIEWNPSLLLYSSSQQLIKSGLICAHINQQSKFIRKSYDHKDLLGEWFFSLFFPFFWFFLNRRSSVLILISVQILLFPEVIKKPIDLLVGDTYLLPPARLFCSTIWTPETLKKKKKFSFVQAFDDATASCASRWRVSLKSSIDRVESLKKWMS